MRTKVEILPADLRKRRSRRLMVTSATISAALLIGIALTGRSSAQDVKVNVPIDAAKFGRPKAGTRD